MSCIDPPHVHATKKAVPKQALVNVVLFIITHHMYSMPGSGLPVACSMHSMPDMVAKLMQRLQQFNDAASIN